MTEICMLYKDAGTSISLPTESLEDTIELENVQIAYKPNAAPIVAYAGRYRHIFVIVCTLTKANKNTLISWSKLALTDGNFAENYPKLVADGDTYEVGFYEAPKCRRIGTDAWKCGVSFIECQR